MSSSSGTPESWISSFCSLLGHEYFAEISEDFIEDDFNLTGLQSQVVMYKEALEMILDVEPEEEEEEDEDEEEEDEDDDDDDGSVQEEKRVTRKSTTDRRHHRMASDLSTIESSAEMLYGLIHQRFVCSRAGIQQMLEKYELAHFGCCPRTFCEGAHTLPVGLSDIPGEDTVKLFCPSCLDVYSPPNSRFQNVDGAFFGRTFGLLFMLTFPDIVLSKKGYETLNSIYGDSGIKSTLDEDGQKAKINGMNADNLAPGLGEGNMYQPKIYGFKISERSRSGPRMGWLRDRPSDTQDLNEASAWSVDSAEESLDEAEKNLPRRMRPTQGRRNLRLPEGSPMSMETDKGK